MPRLKNTLPKLRKHASGNAVVTLCGKDHYLGPWGSAKHPTKAVQAAYDAAIAEWLADGRPTVAKPAESQTTMADLLLAFLRHAASTYGKTPQSRYHVFKRMAKRLKPYYGMLASEFGPSQLKGVREAMVAEGLTRVTINQAIGVVKQIARWGVADELVPVEFYQRLCCVDGLRKGYTVAKEGKPVEPVSAEVVEHTLPFLPTLVQQMVRLQSILGCRPSELCNLRVGDIDQSKTPWHAVLVEHKTAHHGRVRELFFGPKARQIVGPLLEGKSETDYLFDPRESEKHRLSLRSEIRSTPMNQGNRPKYNSHSRSGKRKRTRAAKQRYTQASYRRAITRACDRAFPAPKGLGTDAIEQWRKEHRWAPNQIRHAVATELRNSNDLETAGLVLGHSNLKTTQIYAVKNTAKLRDLMERAG